MSFSAPSNILQDDAENLEKQQQEIQQRHEKEQQLLVQLEEAVKLHWAEHVAQKAKREMEEKAWKEAERQRVVEKKKRKKRTIEYLQQLQDEMLEEEATLLEGAEEFQITGSKCKEIATRDREEQQLSKKAK